MLSKYRKLECGEFIVVGVDTAAGGGDYVAGQFISKTKIDVPYVYHSKITVTDLTNKLPAILEEIYDTTGVRPVVAYERQNGGSFEMDRLGTLNYAGKYRLFKMPNYGRIENPDAKLWGWDTNTATRPKMLSDLKEAIDKHVIRIYDKGTIEEMYSFIVNKTATSWKAQAESGSHDDKVMALAIAWQLFQEEQPQDNNYEVPPDDTLMFSKEGLY